jgi:hypothetical protein
MSSWIKGKIELGCSIDILQKALIRINEDWKEHISVDSSQELTIHGRNERFSVVLRDVNPNYGSSDVGFQRLEDGTWEMTSYDFYQCPNLLGKLKQSIAEMRYEALAEAQANSEILVKETKNGKKRIVMRTPVTKEYLYEA